MIRNLSKGIYFALFAATISGFSIFYNKLVLVKGIDPLIFNIIKNGAVAVIFSLLILSRYKKIEELKKSFKENWYKLVLIGVVGGSIPFFLFFEGLRQTTALNANLIQKTLFVWVGLMALTLLKEKISPIQVIGYIFLITANFFIGGFGGFKYNAGEFMIFAATILWSIETILAKRFLSNADNILISWGRMFFGSLILIIFAFLQHKLFLIAKIRTEQLLPILGSVGFLTGYVFFFFKSLKFASAGIVTSILVLATPITNVLTVVFITHSLSNSQWMSLALNTFGVLLIAFLMREKDFAFKLQK